MQDGGGGAEGIDRVLARFWRNILAFGVVRRADRGDHRGGAAIQQMHRAILAASADIGGGVDRHGTVMVEGAARQILQMIAGQEGGAACGVVAQADPVLSLREIDGQRGLGDRHAKHVERIGHLGGRRWGVAGGQDEQSGDEQDGDEQAGGGWHEGKINGSAGYRKVDLAQCRGAFWSGLGDKGFDAVVSGGL